jgi:UPF0176 protein
MNDTSFVVAALYHFSEFEEPNRLRKPLEELCAQAHILGTLLLAPEGINGTVAGTQEGIDRLLAHIRALSGCATIEVKFSRTATMPFERMRVRIKREIVSMGVDTINAARDKGVHIDPDAWNVLIADPDTILIDTRNSYEVALGTFGGAIDPKTQSFREFPDWFEKFASSRTQPAAAKIAMFCTGGIRCEKATAYVKSLGFENVFHLKGGILKYLETIAPEESKFEGECFLFDRRVALGPGLTQGAYELCGPCGAPLHKSDRQSPKFEEGISCPQCHSQRTKAQLERFAERQKQRMLKKGRASLALSIQASAARNAQVAHPVLFSFRRCPYAMRARMALRVSERAYCLREVSLRDKPPELLQASAKGTVPVLQMEDGSVIDESLEIMRWALQQHDPGGWLTGAGATAALIAENDGSFKRALDRYKYAHRFPEVNALEQRALGLRFLEKLNQCLKATTHLCGETPTLADFAIFPFVRQFAAHDPKWFAGLPLERLRAWLEGHERSALFVEIMQQIKP